MKIKDLIKELQRLDGEKEIGLMSEDIIYEMNKVCETKEWFGEGYCDIEYFVQ